jgi:predicted helicase
MPAHARQILQQATSWAAFKELLQPLYAKEKGDCFELLTRYYLQLHPQYATKLKTIWPLKKVPSPIRQKLKLPVLDEGIDLVAQTKDGEFWAIQCKYLEDETHSLSRRQLSTFTDLAFGVCRNFSLGLVCTSADRYSRKLQLHADRLAFVYGDSWRELDPDFFKRLHRLLEGKVTALKPLQPRPHQQRAVRNACRHFIKEKNRRGKLIMPCGSGKSLAAYWIAEELGAKSILVAVPSLALIRQSLEVWTRETVAKGKQVNWICVCSDESVSRAEEEDTSVLTQDLGIRVHTEPKEIEQWLQAKRAGGTIVFCTYQSGKALAQAAHEAKFSFDLAILDEAHKTVGRQGNLFGFLLNDKNLKIKKRIFMTATERRYLGNSDDIASMDNPNLYKERVYKERVRSLVVSWRLIKVVGI